MPPHIGRVLSIVHTLIAYGNTFADTLRRHGADSHLLPRLSSIAISFGTRDLALILVRITRGLLRATALEARLRRRAARGRDLSSGAIRPLALRPPAARKPRAAKPATPPGEPAWDSRSARLPTPEQIAAEVRRRPIGAVLVDICLDLGIMPGRMDRASWDELSSVLIGHGGSLVRFLLSKDNRLPALPTGDSTGDPTVGAIACPPGSPNPSAVGHSLPIVRPTIAFPAWHVLAAHAPAPACTGPP